MVVRSLIVSVKKSQFEQVSSRMVLKGRSREHSARITRGGLGCEAGHLKNSVVFINMEPSAICIKRLANAFWSWKAMGVEPL